MKNARHLRILEILSGMEVYTQQQITNLLRQEGFKVTQSTVSRDLKELKLKKEISAEGKTGYTVKSLFDVEGSHGLDSAILGAIDSMVYSMNNVVIKTYPGLAQGLASSIERRGFEGILGCVAGDDTIIIVTANEESSVSIMEKIKELKPKTV